MMLYEWYSLMIMRFKAFCFELLLRDLALSRPPVGVLLCSSDSDLESEQQLRSSSCWAHVTSKLTGWSELGRGCEASTPRPPMISCGQNYLLMKDIQYSTLRKKIYNSFSLKYPRNLWYKKESFKISHIYFLSSICNKFYRIKYNIIKLN